jgi:pantoate--beta-alanine ligase
VKVVRRIADLHLGTAEVGLVPTMGALHDGHRSLMKRSFKENDRTIVSIYVNPLQFGPAEDLDRYPRDLERDLELARARGADLVFAPPAAEMYPGGEPWIAVVAERGADRLSGATRPGHFRGVLTVVAKLFGIFLPDFAVFGQKDYQQATLIRRMVADLDMPVAVEVAPIVREADGLALSSRNVYLSAEERARALALSRALAKGRALLAAGEADAEVLRAAMWREMEAAGLDVEYADVVDADTLEAVERAAPGAVVLVAARAGNTRLIDNAVL